MNPRAASAGAAKPLGLVLLGATGSIGANTLDVVARHPDRYRIETLTANGSAERLLELARQHPNVQVLDGSGDLDTVAQAIARAVDAVLR